MRPTLFASALMLAATPSLASAQPKLLSSTPAANATVSKPAKLSLTFSEKLIPTSSGVDLIMTGMPGMASHAPMPIKGFKTSIEGDGRTLTVTLPRALPVGSYNLNWHVAGVDQNKIAGKYSFTVR
ncbi:copper homeostasis periplasmic binding protein CopC [Sphingobium sp. Cam5-1]|uniref:copper homeostasis periplasmic binding protein CopC n=1 Tax=Sphingobium sp. Cam5-1 TaxID=2789327 RepID=UPI0018AD153A|nr:copper homeostasis periplasmic binding protein CopC [Sphingobium sp. Cam5-1]QPI74173.1 copper homeostasis periplasmic binding protein CopC [Sphingobium sp. Cam5-1]